MEDNILVDIFDNEIALLKTDIDDIANGLWEHTETSLFDGIKVIPFKAVVAYVCRQYILDGENDTVIIKPMTKDFREKLSKAVQKRMETLFSNNVTKHLDNQRIASEEAGEDEHRYRIIDQYKHHFRGVSAIKGRRFIRSIPEAVEIRDFIAKHSVNPEQWGWMKEDLQKLNKHSNRLPKSEQPIKWTDIKAKLIAELQTNLINSTSPFKDTARFNKIATYTVNNIILP
jgi:hypothetical protein